MAAKIRPLGEKVLIKRLQAEEKTKSGIYLPESAKEKPQQATVIAVGDGKLLDNGQRAPVPGQEGRQGPDRQVGRDRA